MNQDSNSTDASTKRVSLKNLYLDPNNYRLIHEADQVEVGDAQIKDKTVAQRTFRLVVGEKNQGIQDLIDSFKTNGYLPVDQIQVRELPDGGSVVVEGNRRIAALKFLEREREEKARDIGKLDPAIFSRVPVVLYNDADEMHHLTLMALKHISGNKKWGEWNQAKLLEKMHSSYRLAEEEICLRIGITKLELRRSLRALSLVQQYRNSDYGDQFSETKFPLFREAASNPALKKWLEWDDSTYTARNVERSTLFFSLLSREMPEEQDDGEPPANNRNSDPVIVKRDDIRLFTQILDDPRAFALLVEGRDLNAAYRASGLVFKERQESAISAIENDIDTLSQLAIESRQLPKLETTLGKLQGIVDRARSSDLSGVEQKTVFHDRIDCHYTSLDIQSYKKLHDLRLQQLSRVNLIAGANNCGKTTLLEAIYLLSRQNDFAGMLEVVRRRGKIPEDHIQAEWLVKRLSGGIRISGKFDQQDSAVAIRDFDEEDGSLDRSRYLRSVEIVASHGDHRQESITHIFKGRDRETLADSIKLLCPVVYSSPFFLNEPHRYASFYHRSFQSKALPKILEFIRKEIVPTLTDIRLVAELQRFEVTDEQSASSFDLMEYGEGIQRIFFISLMFASAQNGVILIDEFENAIHADLIERFAPFIHQLALLFNVQVFLTSHSKECIDAFVRNVPAVDDFSYHALVQVGTGIEARQFSGNEYFKLVRAGDVDLRRAE